MRKGDSTMAKKFAGDFLAAVWRGVNTACERSIYEEYFEKEADRFSHKNILLLANEIVTEELHRASILTEEEQLLALDFLLQNMTQNQPFLGRMPNTPNILSKELPDPNQSINENNFVVQFICNRTQTLKNIFQEEWRLFSNRLNRRIVGNMKKQFTKQITTCKSILEIFLERLEGGAKKKIDSSKSEQILIATLKWLLKHQQKNLLVIQILKQEKHRLKQW